MEAEDGQTLSLKDCVNVLLGQFGLNFPSKNGARTGDVSSDSCIARTGQVTSMAANNDRFSC